MPEPLEVLKSYPDTPEGRRAAQAKQDELIALLKRQGRREDFKIGVHRRGGSYWVAMKRR